eukprot:XP_011665131.1 PREDICTED: uncharacterized protein LOC578355 [Strongylocentrotus purpuratus]
MANWDIVSFRLILSIILLPHINGVLNIDSDQEDYDTGSSSVIDIDWTAIRPHIWIPSTTNIGSHLDVRVVDGPNNATGRVEVWYNGAWGTVCDDGWDLNDANVVCRMLGFFKASSAPVRAEYGPGSGDILLDEVECTGSEISLEDCIKSEFGVNNCDHSEDAGVICTDPISLDVRLVDGPNNNSGRVEVQENGSWGTICDDGWDAKDANVVCRMLGFFGAAYAPVQATYGEGVGDISLRNVDCIGTEINLGTCFHDRPEPFDCAHGEDAGAACLVLIPDDSVSSASSWNDDSGSGESSGDGDSGSGESSGDGTFWLQCPDLVSSTDKGLTTSSTVIISPRVHAGSADNQDFSVGCTYTSHDVFDYVDTWVACAARDDLGNYLTCDFTVTVTDDDPPRLDCPDVTSTTDQGLPTSSHITINPRASDNTDPSPYVICSHTSSDVFQFGDTNVFCDATDESGNIGRCLFVVTVQDGEPPHLDCPDITSTTDQGLPTSSRFPNPQASDNTDPSPSVICSRTSSDVFQFGDTNVTCHATDESGNVGRCVFVVTVQAADISREEGSFEQEQAYTVLTYIGCGISIVSLLVTLATYLSNRVLRGKQTNQIFICLCLTLLCLYLSFIVMMSLDSAKRQYQVKAGPCGFITALVHYFVLSSLTWMGVEGYNTYLIIVKIFDTYIPRFMLKAGGVAWGIPALIVIVTGAIAEDKYAHGDVCFLELWAQIGGLLIPMTIILLFNVVIFALIVRQLMKSSNLAGRVKKEAKVERRENIKRVQNAICILLLLGLTWITGYFLMIREFSQVVEPIFIILNSFQGLFIFLLYCVRKPMFVSSGD